PSRQLPRLYACPGAARCGRVFTRCDGLRRHLEARRSRLRRGGCAEGWTQQDVERAVRDARRTAVAASAAAAVRPAAPPAFAFYSAPPAAAAAATCRPDLARAATDSAPNAP
ncbi:hypothetical protein HK405_012518, partial [Cladochytrium tenue]